LDQRSIGQSSELNVPAFPPLRLVIPNRQVRNLLLAGSVSTPPSRRGRILRFERQRSGHRPSSHAHPRLSPRRHFQNHSHSSYRECQQPTTTLLRYLATRVLYTLPVIWLVVSLVFLLIHLVPGDPIQQMLGEGLPAADLQVARHTYGLDLPLGQQYLNYWKGVLHGNLGTSIRYGQGVRQMIAQRYPYTLQLTIAALAVAIVLSIPAGVRSARQRNRWQDRWISVISLFGLSFPNFALGPILILLFAIKIGWLPVSGAGSLANLILPAITMGSALAAILTRMVRTSMLEELNQDYIRTARAKGLDETKVVYRHALRNAMIPVLTVIGLQFGALLAGAIVTETIFSWPGIGRLTIQAISNRDYYLVQGCILAIGLTYVAVNFLTDLLYSAVNPRIRQ